MIRLEAPNLKAPGIAHGFFSAEGGVSTGLYQSLNCGPGSSDDPDAVAQNRRRVAAALGARGWHFYRFIGEHGHRLMCSWATTEEQITRFTADLRAVLASNQ